MNKGKKSYLRVVAKDKNGLYQTLTVNTENPELAKSMCSQYGISEEDVLYVETVKIGASQNLTGLIL